MFCYVDVECYHVADVSSTLTGSLEESAQYFSRSYADFHVTTSQVEFGIVEIQFDQFTHVSPINFLGTHEQQIFSYCSKGNISFTNFQHSQIKTHAFFLSKFAPALLPTDGSYFPASCLSKGRESVTISEKKNRDNKDAYEYWCVFPSIKDSDSLGSGQYRTTGDFSLTVTHQCRIFNPRDGGWSVIWMQWHHTCGHDCVLH